MITAMEMVLADGCLLKISKEKTPNFNDYIINFGALGVVTSITIRLEPEFFVNKEIYENLSFDALFDNLDDIMMNPEIDYLSLFTTWQDRNLESVWIGKRQHGGV